jgi:competence protein ComEC
LKVIQYFWNILTVSIAAQIGAFPLSVYYFHQFPALFFVTNLVIIPFLGILMTMGLAILILAGIGYTPVIPIKLLETCIGYLNEFIAYIASFENFIVKDIPFNTLMLWSSYIMIISIVLWLFMPKYKRFVVAVMCVLAFQAIGVVSRLKAETNHELIIFNMPKHTLISARYGNEIDTYTDLPCADQNQTITSYAVANFSNLQKSNGICNWMEFYGKSLLVIDSALVYPELSADALLLIQSPKVNLQRVIRKVRPKIVIADASNFKSLIEPWKETCLNEKIPFHYTNEKGFYRISKY